MERRELIALDRWITRDCPWQDEDEAPDFDEVEVDMPDPCDECEYVGMHGMGCSQAPVPTDEELAAHAAILAEILGRVQ